jgi:hypothetical protein
VPDSDPPSAFWHAGAVTAVRNATPEILMHRYAQVCASYHAIDDFRGKLLTLWPILGGAAGAVALLVAEGRETVVLLPLGIFGFFVCCGVGLYEWTQSLRCVEIQMVAGQLEEAMTLSEEQSQFRFQKGAYKLQLRLPPEEAPQKGRIVRPRSHVQRSHALRRLSEARWDRVSRPPASQPSRRLSTAPRPLVTHACSRGARAFKRCVRTPVT